MFNKAKNSLSTNAILNVIKQICAIVFPMITFPYATRVLGSFNYGKINFSSSIISYISLMAGLGITNYAIREGARIRNNKKAIQDLSNELFTINIVSTFFSLLFLFVLIRFWGKLDGYAVLLSIQGSSILFTTLGTDWLNSIYEDYLYISIRYIVCQIISILLMVALVRSSNDYIIYAFTNVLGTVVANILNMFYVRKKYDIYPRIIFSNNIFQHIKPIMILCGTSVATMIYVNSDITILGVLKGENAVGIYSVSVKIYSMVKQILSALLVVTIPRISSMINEKTNKEVKLLLENIAIFLFAIIFPACVGLGMISREIIILFSGSEYINATASLQILSISLIFATLVTFYIYVILIPYKKEKIALYSTIVAAIVNVVLNFLLIPGLGIEAAALTTVIAESITAMIGLFYTRKVITLKVKKPLIVGLVNGLCTFFICLGLRIYILNELLYMLMSVAFSVIMCGLISAIAFKDKYNR